MEKDQLQDQARRLEIIETRLRELEDIEEIRKLKATYCACADGGWPDQGPTHMGPFADLFVEDGIWDGRPLGPLAEGRDAIHKLVILGHRPILFIQHYVMNPKIEIASDGNTATGKWHLIAPATFPDGVSKWLLGVYDERYVRTAQGWRFQSIRFVTSRIAEQLPGWTEALTAGVPQSA